jgi:molybdopterin converting factor small subunit
MIGRLTETAMTAVFLALTIEQLCWPQDEEAYGELRAEAQGLIDELGLDGVVVPERQDVLTANVGAITTPLTAHLSAERGRVLGDTIALPLFYLQSFALRYAIHAGLENPDAGLLEIIEDCIEDLGLDRDLARVLEREAGWITLAHEGDEPTIRRADVIKAAASFFARVFEEFGRTETGLEGIQEAVTALKDEVADFRAEFRSASERLERLVVEGNAEVMAALGELQTALVQQEGVEPAAAAALTAGDPQGLWERLVRWLGGAPARDAAEAAIWAALDFVPAGTGIKLGIKVAGAIRKSLAAGGK